MKGILTRTEKILLLATAAFLCLLLTLYGARTAARSTGAVEAQHPVPQSEAAPREAKLDLNAASAAQLEELPGIGPVLAGRIVADREANGPYSAVSDVTRVEGIGQGKLALFADLVTVG
jgi:competence protein ComEA